MKRTRALMHTGDDHGWTVVELMVVMLIIGVLLAMAVAVFSTASDSASAAACRENQQIMNRAIAVARASGAEIDEMDDIAASVVNFDKVSTCPLDGTPLEYDSVTDTVTCPNHP